MLSMLIAYDADGNVVATLDHMVAKDADGNVIDLIDFEAHELAGGEHTDIFKVANAVGAKTWPEWLGAHAHEFRVEKDGPPGAKRIVALVHKESGHRRERAAIESAIAARVAKANGQPADIRDIVGGPGAYLRLDRNGKTLGRAKRSSTPSHLPLIGATPGDF